MKDQVASRPEQSLSTSGGGPAGLKQSRSEVRRRLARLFSRRSAAQPIVDRATLLGALSMEKKRCDRTGRRFALVLLRTPEFAGPKGSTIVSHVERAIGPLLRDTDVIGWYEEGAALGILFTEIGEAGAVTAVLTKRIRDALAQGANSRLPGDIKILWQWSAEGTRDDAPQANAKSKGVSAGETASRAQASPQSAS